MPGSITADLLKKRPLELALRALLAFGIAFWLVARLAPIILETLLPFYEQAIHLVDDHYRLDLSLTHRTGHDVVGSDLVLLVQATVVRTFMVFGSRAVITMQPGEILQSSTATGLLMQPAIMICGLLLAWPARSAAEVLLRLGIGAVLLAAWLLLGIPLSLWIYFQDIPLRVFAPREVSFLADAGRFLLNGGSVALGALAAGGALFLAARLRPVRPTS